MEVPSHMHITASLMAGYTFLDGSLVEVDSNGDYRITSAGGETLADSTRGNGWDSMSLGIVEDYGDILDDLAAFLGHDAELWGSVIHDIELDEEELIFGIEVAEWANMQSDELSMLACYREDKRLVEEA